MTQGKVLWAQPARTRSIEGLAFAYLPGCFLVSGSADRYVDVFDSRNTQARCNLRCPGRVTRILYLAGTPNVLVCLSTGYVFAVDVRTGKPAVTLGGATEPILDCCVGANGRICVTCGDSQKALVYRIQ